MLAIYLTSGLPNRGIELATLRFLNSIKDQRELFIDKGSLLFILKISYSKNQQVTDNLSKSLKYLPPSLSYILLLYLVLIQPFTRFLEVSLNQSLPYSPYLFYIDKGYLSSFNLSAKLKSFIRLHLGLKINIQSYRQIIVAVVRYFLREDID